MKNKIDLTNGSILSKLLIVAIPTLLTSIVQMTYNLTDMFWVGKVGSMGLDPKEAIAGVGTAGYFPWFGFGIIMLAKIGTSVKVSHAAGANDVESASRYGNNGMVIMFVLAIVYSLLGFFGKDLYVSIFNSDNANVVSYATDYLGVISLFGMSYFMVNLFNGIYDGLGLTIIAFAITASGLVLNIILDPIFILDEINIFDLHTITGLGMGVKGAAIATGISQSFILLTYLVVFISKYRPIHINFKKYVNIQTIKEILKIGAPVSIQSMIFTMISVVLGVMVTSFGATPMAIQRLGSQIEALAWMIASGFQVALASYVGQNFGAKNFERVRKGYVTSMRLLIPYGIGVNIVLFVFARQLIGIFLQDEEALRIGQTYLEILSFSQVFMIIELATAGAFNGLGKTKIPSGVGIIGNAMRIPLGYALSLSLGFAGIWWAVSLSSVFKGVVLMTIFVYYLIRIKKQGGIFVENKPAL